MQRRYLNVFTLLDLRLLLLKLNDQQIIQTNL